MSGRILIAGTGRAGTSFLVRLLTQLGYDTGFSGGRDGFNPQIRAGCERIAPEDIHRPEAWARMPRIVKSPYLSILLPTVPVEVERVFCSVREFQAVTQSRESVGLLWERTPAEVLGQLVADCTLLNVPLTLMRFPESLTDPDYCREKLAEGLPDILEHPGFDSAFASLQPEPVNV